MSETRRRKLLIAVAALVVLLGAWRVLSVGRISREARADFEWFSTLGFPDVKGLPFVRVNTGEKTESEGPRDTRRSGFLLSSSSNAFTVVSPYLEKSEFVIGPPDSPKDEKIGYELMDFRVEMRRGLEMILSPYEESGPFDEGNTDKFDRSGVFALAWCCWRQGMDREALRLYEHARSMPPYPEGRAKRRLLAVKAAKRWIKEHYEDVKGIFSRNASTPKPISLREEMENERMELKMKRAVAGFADEKRSRAQLLEDFESFAREFPNSDERTNALEIAAKLKDMIAEDQAHKKIGSNELAALPPDERARELVFQLRDVTKESLHDVDDPPAVKTPAYELLQMGYAAIPQLLTAVDSDVFSRTIYDPTEQFPLHYSYNGGSIQTVGYLVRNLMARITERDFSYPNASSMGRMTNGVSQYRVNAEAWWAEFQKKGEKQTLIEGVASRSEYFYGQAERLANKYPEELVPALLAGVRQASDPGYRVQYVSRLAQTHDAAAVAFLHEEMRNGPSMLSRLMAAKGLWDHGAGSEAVAAMIQEWEHLPLSNPGNGDEPEFFLARFLVSVDLPDGVRALGRNFRRFPKDVRLAVLNVAGDTNRVMTYWEATNAPSAATLAAIEEFLAGSLDDTDEDFGGNFSDDVEVPNPRMSDVAAHYLAQRWPERYKFDIAGSLKTRERQRIECLNVWRRAHQLAELPVPQFPVTKVKPADSCKVTMIEWATNSAKPSKAFEARVAKFNGKRLRVDDVIGLLSRFAREPEAGTAGFEFIAEKDNDLSGVRIIARLIPGKADEFGVLQEMRGWVTIGKERLADENRSSFTGFDDDEDWLDLEEAMGKAVAAPPQTQFKIRVRVISDEPSPSTQLPAIPIR